MNRRVAVFIVAFAVMASGILHVFDTRYYFRVLPLPLWAFETVDDVLGDTLSTPPPQQRFLDTLPLFDFSTRDGQKRALRYVRALSPTSAPKMTYENLTVVDTWFDRLQQFDGYCTDFSNLLVALAARAGLKAREWIFWHDDWSTGNAHSVAEIQLPSGRWISLDGQHATIIGRNRTLSMTQILNRAERGERIGTVSLPVSGKLAATHYRGLEKLPSGAMLNLHPPTWTKASVPAIVTIPILYRNSPIDLRVWTSKLAFIAAMIAAIVMLIQARSTRRRMANARRSGLSAQGETPGAP